MDRLDGFLLQARLKINTTYLRTTRQMYGVPESLTTGETVGLRSRAMAKLYLPMITARWT